MLPVAFFDIGFLISLVIGQRKLDTLTLQGIIGSKIIDKIVERFVRFCRFGLFRQFLLMDRIGFVPDRIHLLSDRCKGVDVRFLVSTGTKDSEHQNPRN